MDFTPSDLAVDREGRRLAVNNADHAAPRVVILELETGRVLADWRSQVGVGYLNWSADGRLLADGGDSGDLPRLHLECRPRALSSVLQGDGAGRFVHTGYLLVASGRLWDAASGEPLVSAPGRPEQFSPDDHRLAFVNAGKVGVWDVELAPECRTLHPAMFGNRDERREVATIVWADFSPDGRLLATSDQDGVRIWEVETGRELAQLKTSACETVLFDPDGQGLISSGRWGLYRWPIRPDPDRGPDAIRVGPPELLRESAGRWRKAAWLPDHRKLALVDDGIARVLILDSKHPHPAWSRGSTLDSGENHRMISVDVSPDGRWLAAGGWYEVGVRVWDLHRRRLERVLTPPHAVSDTKFWSRFSADGRWLISLTHPDAGKVSYDFWRVGTWELDHRIEPERNGGGALPPVFTADGRLMALGIAPDQILLADAATGRELARLTTLQSVTPTPLAFSPDATKLVASTDKKTVLIWDLRRIRDRLVPMGLDWDAPPYPAASVIDASGPVPPARPVRVVGEVIEPEARRTAELAELNRQLAARPDNALALVHRGWLFTQRKKWPEAIADLSCFSNCAPVTPTPAGCWPRTGETGNLARGVAAFGRLLQPAPDDRDARTQRGQIALALGQPSLASEDFSRILAVEPNWNCYRRARSLSRWPAPRGACRPRHTHPETLRERGSAVRPPRHRPRNARRS